MLRFMFAMLLGAGMAKAWSAPTAAAPQGQAQNCPPAKAHRARARPALVKLKEPAWLKNPPHYDAAFLKVKPAPPPAWMKPHGSAVVVVEQAGR